MLTKYRSQISVLALTALMVGGCATKQYPLAVTLSSAEAVNMSCAQLDMEIIKLEEYEKSIDKTKSFNFKSIMGILADLGIGNAMARSTADSALQDRKDSIRNAQVAKKCAIASSGK